MRNVRLLFSLFLLLTPAALFAFGGESANNSFGTLLWKLTQNLYSLDRTLTSLPETGQLAQIVLPPSGPPASSYTVSVVKTGGGDGIVQGTGLSCGIDCSEIVSTGSVYILHATPLGNSFFTGWSGACTGTGSCILQINSGKNVTANFVQGFGVASIFTLRVIKSGTGTGNVFSGSIIECGSDCTHTGTQGTTLTLTPAVGSLSRFSGWVGGGCTGTAPCQITLNRDTEVYAFFDGINDPSSITPTQSGQQYTLQVVKSGGGDGIIIGPGIACGSECKRLDVKWTSVVLRAFPQSNSFFNGWSGAPCSGRGECEVLFNKDYTVTGIFLPNTVNEVRPSPSPSGPVEKYAVVVNKIGTGIGTVSAGGLPPAINCGNDCNEPFTKNSQVTLSASVGLGSEFKGWTGEGCSGVGTCVLTVTGNKIVTARFDKAIISPPGYFEAENATLSESMSSLKDANASNGRYISSGVRDYGRATLPINVSTTGNYVIWARILSKDIQSDSLYVSLDGGLEDIYDTAEGLWSPQWQWTRITGRSQNGGHANVGNANPRIFNLGAGNHTLTFRTRDPNTKLDKIFLTTSRTLTPTGFVDSPSPAPPGSRDAFTRNLTLGSQGEDVRRLQKFLNGQGLIVARSGIGSPGNESSYYGTATADAVARFQERYTLEILGSRGLTSGTGILDEITRKKLNSLVGPI